MERNIIWSRLDELGMEHLHLTEGQYGFTANGLILAVKGNVAYRIGYTIHCDTSWHVREVRVEVLNSSIPPIHLKADGKGHWRTSTGERVTALDGCIDVDISATPFTNTVAMKRLGLAVGEVAEITVAYIKVPEMQITSVKQRYTFIESNDDGEHYQYAGYPSGYQAELVVDRDKLVIAYPDLFMRVWSSEEITAQQQEES